MSDHKRPAPGKIKITPVGGKQTAPGLPDAKQQPIPWWVSLFFLLILVGIAHVLDSPTYQDYLSSTSPTAVVPAGPPTPAVQMFNSGKPVHPPRYAAFLSRDKTKELFAIVFTLDRLEIRTVQSIKEIPAEDLAQIIEARRTKARKPLFPGLDDWPGEQSPMDVFQSRVGRHLKLTLPREVRSAVELTPYIFYGNVDIETGDLIHQDLLYTSLVASYGELREAKFNLVSSSPRGPPDETRGVIRRVYVVGKILNFSGPYRFDQSTANVKIVDLGKKDSELGDRTWTDTEIVEAIKKTQDPVWRLQHQLEDLPRSTYEQGSRPGELPGVHPGRDITEPRRYVEPHPFHPIR